MPAKNDAPGAEAGDLITNFSTKECKMLAAAFISSIGPDKYDYDLMATLTGNTSGSLKKMWPPVKKKAIELHASFGAFLGQTSGNATGNGEAKVATPSKATPAKKRKAVDDTTDSTANEKNATPLKGRGRPKKQVKKEEPSSEDETTVQASVETSANDANESANENDGQDQETMEET